MEIVPAIMPDSFEDFSQKAQRVAGISEWAQIDVMDQEFVPSVSWPYRLEDTENFISIIKGETSLPFADELKYEIDLMVSDPEGELHKWSKIPGIKRFIVHIESIKDLDVLEQLILMYKKDDKTEFGLAISPGGPLDVVLHYINDIDVVQCMGIEKIGYQGQPFTPQVIDTIKRLREARSDVIISVDGGVSTETALQLTQAGANRLVSGSAIFNSDDVSEAVRTLEASAEGF